MRSHRSIATLRPGRPHLPGEFVVAGERPHREQSPSPNSRSVSPELDLFLHACAPHVRASRPHPTAGTRAPRRSARSSTAPPSAFRSCTSSRSRSLNGASSPRPYPPVASSATRPLSSRWAAHRLVEQLDDPFVGDVTQRAAVGEPTLRTVGTGGLDLMLVAGSTPSPRQVYTIGAALARRAQNSTAVSIRDKNLPVPPLHCDGCLLG